MVQDFILIKEFYTLKETAKALNLSYTYLYVFCTNRNIQITKVKVLGLYAPAVVRLIKHFKPAATVTINAGLTNAIYL
jgi:hypothetical protein